MDGCKSCGRAEVGGAQSNRGGGGGVAKRAPVGRSRPNQQQPDGPTYKKERNWTVQSNKENSGLSEHLNRSKIRRKKTNRPTKNSQNLVWLMRDNFRNRRIEIQGFLVN